MSMNLPAPTGGEGVEPVLTSFGDISVSQNYVYVPAGRRPIRGSVWTVQDMSHTTESISTTGIVLCVLFVWFCLLGLLFLLMKETKTVGFIQVTVQGDGYYHASSVPASPHAWSMANNFVNYSRSLSATS